MSTNSSNQWSPFDPEWYKDAFDDYIPTADYTFNQDEIIKAGYQIPDSDGSKSSVFRQDAVLNNSFNEEKLKATLADIYMNNSHRLTASNHDNVHFKQWHFHMEDMEKVPNTVMCECIIPVDSFIDAKTRDKFKLSQYYRKWVTLDAILNKNNIFGWHVLLFVNQRIYSDYEFRIDDQVVTVRFRYEKFWYDRNYSVDLYKFDVKSSCRIGITRELVTKQWNWKLPVSYFSNKTLQNSDRMILAFNRIRDPEIRTDGIDADIMGDNLEFVTVEDGLIDLNKLSTFNKNLIMSEESAWMWMSAFVPRFLHEYPILLPVDVIYRPYQTEFIPVMAENDSINYNVKTDVDTDTSHKLFINLKNDIEWNDGWKQTIRPVVLSDAFKADQPSIYHVTMEELYDIRDASTAAADRMEELRNIVADYTTDRKFLEICDKLDAAMNDIHDLYVNFMISRHIEVDQEYDSLFEGYNTAMIDIRENKNFSQWFRRQQGKKKDFWSYTSPLISIPLALVDKFYISSLLDNIEDTTLWEKDYPDKLRFARPIDITDFWTFEYDMDNHVWRPFVLNVTHHFPDVYTLDDPNEETPTKNRIFKTFFFYSDTMNVTTPTTDMVDVTPEWNPETYNPYGAIYRDIFMEKFYWMGIRSIYKGLIMTDYKWEIIEYIQDNSAFERFNELFMNSMDPYFKMGLATYLRSSDYMFPFDDAINKMKEAMTSKFLGYNKITNFESYLNNTWVPSYFDNVTRIMDDWNGDDRLIRRPRSSFDTTRFLPTLIEIQSTISVEVSALIMSIDDILADLSVESYGINVELINTLRSMTKEIDDNINEVIQLTNSLDIDIYSINDVNHICDLLRHHIELMANIADLFTQIHADVLRNKVYEEKQSIIGNTKDKIISLRSIIDEIISHMTDFNIDQFMKLVDDPDFWNAKDRTEDGSLIGIINQFHEAWPKTVKDARDKLHLSVLKLYSSFKSGKDPLKTNINEVYELATTVQSDIEGLMLVLTTWWDSKGSSYDETLIDLGERSTAMITALVDNLSHYIDAYSQLIDSIDNIRSIIIQVTEYHLSDAEMQYMSSIDDLLSTIIEDVSSVNNTDTSKVIEDYEECLSITDTWLEYLDNEKIVFDKILVMSETPNPFIESMERFNDLLEAMIEYMDTVNRPFIPDDQWPTYVDVYEIESVDIVTGGYNNNVGDIAFFKSIGAFEISEVADPVNKATQLTLLPYRTTVFRDPCIQSLNPYDSITNGEGMGIAVKAATSRKTVIINDEVITNFITKSKKIIDLVRLNLNSINPYSNIEIGDAISRLTKIRTEWDKLNVFYSEHISEESHVAMDGILSSIETLLPELDAMNEIRARNNLAGILSDMDKFIRASYQTFEAMGKITSTYLYFDNRLRVVYNAGTEFFGNGSTWNDRERLVAILEDISYELELFNRKILFDLPEDHEVRVMCTTLRATIDSNPTVLAELDAKIIDIIPIIDDIDYKIENMPELQRDIWYNLSQVGIAQAGSGYRLGDIVEIIPKLPNDSEGNVIYDQEDIIMNDVILCRITKITDDVVTEVEPLISYALPYQLWGSRETITRTGTGTGLVLNMYSVIIGLKDSKIFRDPSSDEDKLPQYDENDLFAFKFENIYDMDITYEVFFAGKQIRNFIVRHESGDDPLHPSNIDVIYLNANEVMELSNSSIYQEGEDYFVYKINDIEILDPGIGYTTGQEIVVNTEQIAVRLKIMSLMDNPYHQIREVEAAAGSVLFNKVDPTTDEAHAVPDSLNNIDDEYHSSYYDELPAEGILKPATPELPAEQYPFISHRFDDLDGKNRNEVWMHPDVDLPEGEDVPKEGDPDGHWYQGTRINESRKWNGIASVVNSADGIVPDTNRLPVGQPWTGEYQFIDRQLIHDFTNEEDNSNVLTATKVDGEELRPRDFSTLKKLNYNLSSPIIYTDERIVNDNSIEGDLTVDTYAHLPRHFNEWPDAIPGKRVVVTTDETQNNHRTIYRFRSSTVTGYFIYDEPEIADYKWDYFDIDWMKTNYYPDIPSVKQTYPSDIWWTAPTYRAVQEAIQDGTIEKKFSPITYPGTYITDLTVDDLSVYNYTTQTWEDLHDESRWELTVRNDDENKDWGFRLTFKGSGNYSYDMRLYLNKVAENQLRNAELKRDALFKISASIYAEVDTLTLNTSINTGRTLRIRKLFPYEQKESYTISESAGYTMNFKLAEYKHFKNELHLEDVRIFNKSANRFEDLQDTTMFEVRFKDPKAVQSGFERQRIMTQSIISIPGSGFTNGDVWCWNSERKVHVFGKITADFLNDGHILTFTPIHCSNFPEEDTTLEFKVYQHATQNTSQAASVIIEFATQDVEVYGDGYIHNVTNPMAPLPDEFQVICNYTSEEDIEYDLMIIKSSHTWVFVEPEWISFPTFYLDGYSIPANSIYIMTSNGRFPLVNPATGKPSMYVYQTDTGTAVQFLNIYNEYEHLEIHSVPYPMRSVYTQRYVPESGYINLAGKINKPLNKKYFEFWMNGRLLDDEVTIISPTKIFLHGLKSLRNFEIIEINRDQVEYFSDSFLSAVEPEYGRPYPIWDYNTYLDDALSGTLEGDNYSLTEQEALLTPVWHQVDRDNPEYRNYPPNQDIEDDILLRINGNSGIIQADSIPYQFAVINVPTIEGVPISGRNIRFDDFNFIPISNSSIIDIINEEWKEEIESGELSSRIVVSDDEWFGVATRLYDEYGMLVHTLNESAYYVSESNMLKINSATKLSRIVKTNVIYDLD